MASSPHDKPSTRSLYNRHFSDPRRERAFLSAASFNVAFATTRTVTHAIRAGRGPFRNVSAGGRHIHHLTFGILGLLTTGYLSTNQFALGVDPEHRAASRASAVAYGISSALTLDEFALWIDLQDDYWTQAGRKSIDAVALFSSLLTTTVLSRNLVRELVLARRYGARHAEAIMRSHHAARH